MPSTRPLAALAVAALVLLSGCSMLQCGPDPEPAPAPAPSPEETPGEYEFVFASDTGGTAFDATVTIAANNTTLHSEDFSSDGNGSYAPLTTLSTPGPYTVTVNTTLPGVGGGNRSRQFTVDRPMGNATAIQVTYRGIRASSFRLPRRSLQYPVAANTNAIEGDEDLPMNITAAVTYRGEQVANGSAQVESGELARVVELNETGVYRVQVWGPEGTETDLVVVSEPQQTIAVRLDADGRIERIHADEPIPWM
jgi:hypothetical protein